MTKTDINYSENSTRTIDKKSIRRTDLDWIRILAVMLLVPFHSALIFVLSPHSVMYVKDTVNSGVLDHLAGWIHQFHMPILFYVAGASTYFALKKRTAFQYVKERFLKLLVPAISGICLLIPPMTYITAMAQGTQTTFLQHFLGFWRINPIDLNGITGNFTPAHLWFLIFLFIFSLIGLPLFLLIKGDRITNGLKKIIDKTGAWVIIAILFLLSTLAAKTNILGDINPIYYFISFFAGYLLMIDERIQISIDKIASYALVLGICTEITRQFFMSDIHHLTNSDTVTFIIKQLNRWLWVFAILGYGHRFLNKSNNLLKYLASASFPFYIFHLLVNTIIGFFIIKLPICIGVKYVIIVVLTIISTFGVYEVVKRFPFVRFLFGIKKDKRQ